MLHLYSKHRHHYHVFNVISGLLFLSQLLCCYLCNYLLFFFFFRFLYWTRQQQPSTMRQIASSRRPFVLRLAAAPPSSLPIVSTQWWAAAGSWFWTTARCVYSKGHMTDCMIAPYGPLVETHSQVERPLINCVNCSLWGDGLDILLRWSCVQADIWCK